MSIPRNLSKLAENTNPSGVLSVASGGTGGGSAAEAKAALGMHQVATTGSYTDLDNKPTTTQITEGTNLYFTDARVRAAISAGGSLTYNSSTGVFSYTTPSTSGITEGTNLYYTDARARAAISVTGSGSYNATTGVITVTGGVTSVNTRTGAVTLNSADVTDALGFTPYNATNPSGYITTAQARAAVSATGSLSYNSTTGVFSYTTPSTSGITEGSNLYFTDSRARGAVSATGSLSYNSTTGVFSYTTPTTSGIAEGTNLYYTDARAVSANTSAIATAKSEAIASAATDATAKANAAQAAAIAAVTNGAGAAFDTLKEIQDAMATDQELAAAIAGLTIGNATQTISAGTGLSGGGSFTANQTSPSTVTLSLATAGTAGTYTKVTTDAYGRVTSGTTLSSGDIPSLSGLYLPLTGGTLTGPVTIDRSSGGTEPYIGLTIRNTTTSAGIKFQSNARTYEIQSGSDGVFLIYDRTAEAYRFTINSSGTLFQGNSANPILHAGNVGTYAHTISTDPSTSGPGTLAIGNNGSYSFVQSHAGQPLNLNPAGNPVNIAGNTVLHAGNYTSYASESGGSSVVLKTASNGYLYINNWINTAGGGLFSSVNGAHFYPTSGSYGAWRMDGSKDGWRGLNFSDAVVLMMNDNESGHHRNSYGWQFRWNDGTLYCHKNSQGGGTSATVLDSSNYTNYSLATSTSDSRYVRRDTDGQYLRPFYQYGSNLTTESPATLRDQMGSSGGLRVDFMNPSYTGSGGWNHVITWSAYQFYNMYQLGGAYDGGTGTDLWVRSEANHGGTGWTAWRKLLNSANYTQYSPSLTGSGASGTWGINVTGTAYGLDVHTGRNNEVNKVVRTDANGYIQAGWINTTSGDSGFASRLTRIYASDDAYLRYLPLTDFKVSIGESAKNSYSRRVDYTSDANYHVGSFGHSGYGANETFHGGSGFFDIWGGTNYPPSTSHIHGFNALHYTVNSLGSTGGNAYGIQLAGQYDQGGLIFTRACSGGSFTAWRRQIDDNNYNNYSPTLTGGNASGTWNISITGSASSASSASTASSATVAARLQYADGPRDLSDRRPNTFNRTVVFDFVGAGTGNGAGNYAGVMTYSPWDGTSASTGDSSYQLAFANQSGVNASGPARLSVRNGINTTWNSWQEIFTSSNYNSYSPTLTGGNASGTWGINITGRGYPRRSDGGDLNFYWAGQGGQPSWLWGGNDGANMYVYNPSNFSVSYASTCGTASRATRANGNFYIDDNYGNTIVGAYISTRYQGVFAMGDSYKLPADGTSTGSLYGMAWSHPNAGGAAGNLSDHGLLIINNGVFRCAISNSIVAATNITAYSDERLKTNWQPMPDNYVSRLAQVKVGIYDRTDQEDVTQVGVSAQSLQKLLPQAIMTAKDEMQTLSVSYGNAALASAVELAKHIVKQDERIARLEALIQTLLKE